MSKKEINEKDLHAGHRKRMKKTFMKTGFSGFHDHEILEMLLYTTYAQGNTNPLAHRLIKQFGSISKVFDAPYNELCKTDGVGEKTAYLLKLIPAMSRVYLDDKHSDGFLVTSTEHACDFLRTKYVDKVEEVSSVLLMNNKGKVLNWCEIARGDMTWVNLSIRRVLELVFSHAATSVILCHNHPSGIALPTTADVNATKKVAKALKNIEVALLDHIIIGGEDCVSMEQTPDYAYIFELYNPN